jgi:hypothetical protein
MQHKNTSEYIAFVNCKLPILQNILTPSDPRNRKHLGLCGVIHNHGRVIQCVIVTVNESLGA